MSKLAGHWDEAGADLDWFLIERELTSPFKPMEALAQTVKNDKNLVNNPILGHLKMVWQEVHKRYASIWHNPEIKIERQPIYWARWLRKDIRIIDDLFENGNFLLYIRFKENN